MFSRISRPEPDAIEVIIGPRASFNGNLRSDTSVRIDGAVEGGHIETPANVILTETARAQCDITARVVSIRGSYKGTIRADRVELLAGCQVYGALYVNSFFMDDNVLLRAELNIENRGASDDARLQPLRSEARPNIPIFNAFGGKQA